MSKTWKHYTEVESFKFEIRGEWVGKKGIVKNFLYETCHTMSEVVEWIMNNDEDEEYEFSVKKVLVTKIQEVEESMYDTMEEEALDR